MSQERTSEPQDERTTEQATETATARLQRTRAALRQEWQNGSPSTSNRQAAEGSAAAASQRGPPAASTLPWLDAFLASPGVAGWVETLRGWWWQHPLRVYGIVAGEAGTALARPLAERHPVALMAGAAAAGALLVWSRPWRWLLRPALFAGLLPRLASQAVSQMPLQSWVAALSTMTRPPQRQPPAPH